MHGLEVIKAMNEAASNQETRSDRVQFDSTQASGGVQQHSRGEFFPVIEYQIGDDTFVSEAFGVKIKSRSREAQHANSKMMKMAESKTDQIVAQLSSKGSNNPVVDVNLYNSIYEKVVLGTIEDFFPNPE